MAPSWSHVGNAPWYTPDLYTVVTDSRENICIAPCKFTGPRPKRCGSEIKGEGRTSIVALQNQICRSRDVYDIVEKTRDLVEKRCCEFARHREKLKEDAECHRLVAEMFIDEFTAARLLRVSVPRDLLLFSLRNDHANQLIPYQQDTNETFMSVLRSRVIVGPEWGRIYAFTTPAYPGMVKIGFTGQSWKERRSWLEECMPDAELVDMMQVWHPERMEKLIHLELQSYRRRIVRCKKCDIGHCEFFELPVATVEAVFDDWYSILADEDLYVANCLNAAWDQRIQGKMDLVSAAMLCQLIEQENQKPQNALQEQIDSIGLNMGRLQIEAMPRQGKGRQYK